MTRRQLKIAISLVVIFVAALAAMGLFDGGNDSYQVRAIFRNASHTIVGEDVKIAGARVGDISELEVTPDGKAAIVLDIQDKGFQDFRSDAECAIRLQSVIGEKLIECQPTQPRPEGAPPPPKLRKIPKGEEGAGQYLLPESNTVTPVDVDLINDIQRLPYRQRFTILFSELGIGLAGRGEDLRKVLRDADPALKQLDRVVKILADQNDLLRDLAVDGDRVLGEWVKRRSETADFIEQANTVAQATAERGDDLERNFEKFPEFLRQLKPTMARLGALSDEMTPVITDLGANGSDISRFLINLGPFARNAVPSFRTLGQAGDIGGPALEVARPVIQLLAKFAGTARPLSANLKRLAVNLRETDTIQRAMDVIYFGTLAANGINSFGHYFRTAALNGCTGYNFTSQPCKAKFTGGSTATTSSSATGISPLARVLRTPARDASASTGGGSRGRSNASAARPRRSGPAAAARTKASGRGNDRSREALLDYLLGDGSR